MLTFDTFCPIYMIYPGNQALYVWIREFIHSQHWSDFDMKYSLMIFFCFSVFLASYNVSESLIGKTWWTSANMHSLQLNGRLMDVTPKWSGLFSICQWLSTGSGANMSPSKWLYENLPKLSLFNIGPVCSLQVTVFKKCKWASCRSWYFPHGWRVQVTVVVTQKNHNCWISRQYLELLWEMHWNNYQTCLVLVQEFVK